MFKLAVFLDWDFTYEMFEVVEMVKYSLKIIKITDKNYKIKLRKDY